MFYYFFNYFFEVMILPVQINLKKTGAFSISFTAKSDNMSNCTSVGIFIYSPCKYPETHSVLRYHLFADLLGIGRYYDRAVPSGGGRGGSSPPVILGNVPFFAIRCPFSDAKSSSSAGCPSEPRTAPSNFRLRTAMREAPETRLPSTALFLTPAERQCG